MSVHAYVCVFIFHIYECVCVCVCVCVHVFASQLSLARPCLGASKRRLFQLCTDNGYNLKDLPGEMLD